MKLTKNFSKKEFDSKDGSPMPPEVLLNVQKLATQLQALRDVLNAPIRINSGYRSPNHNNAVGGSKNSQHVFGRAADIVVKGKTPKQVYDIIEGMIASGDMLQGGLGLYDTFVHYDIAFKAKKRRWDFRKNK
jgi:uncharacterized protein YcbK (DUF882 family)